MDTELSGEKLKSVISKFTTYFYEEPW